MKPKQLNVLNNETAFSGKGQKVDQTQIGYDILPTFLLHTNAKFSWIGCFSHFSDEEKHTRTYGLSAEFTYSWHYLHNKIIDRAQISILLSESWNRWDFLSRMVFQLYLESRRIILFFGILESIFAYLISSKIAYFPKEQYNSCDPFDSLDSNKRIPLSLNIFIGRLTRSDWWSWWIFSNKHSNIHSIISGDC